MINHKLDLSSISNILLVICMIRRSSQALDVVLATITFAFFNIWVVDSKLASRIFRPSSIRLSLRFLLVFIQLVPSLQVSCQTLFLILVSLSVSLFLLIRNSTSPSSKSFGGRREPTRFSTTRMGQCMAAPVWLVAVGFL